MNNNLAMPNMQGIVQQWNTDDFFMSILFVPALNRYTVLIIAKDEETFNKCTQMVHAFSSINQVTLNNSAPDFNIKKH